MGKGKGTKYLDGPLNGEGTVQQFKRETVSQSAIAGEEGQNIMKIEVFRQFSNNYHIIRGTNRFYSEELKLTKDRPFDFNSPYKTQTVRVTMKRPQPIVNERRKRGVGSRSASAFGGSDGSGSATGFGKGGVIKQTIYTEDPNDFDTRNSTQHSVAAVVNIQMVDEETWKRLRGQRVYRSPICKWLYLDKERLFKECNIKEWTRELGPPCSCGYKKCTARGCTKTDGQGETTYLVNGAPCPGCGGTGQETICTRETCLDYQALRAKSNQ